MDIFQRIDAPRKQASLAINSHANWYTWSPHLLPVFKAWGRFARSHRPPRLRHVLRGESFYDYTYTMQHGTLPDPDLARQIRLIAEGLQKLRLGRKITLLTELLSTSLGARALHFLLAHVRDILAELGGDNHDALYAPLGSTGKDQKAFPLHADLYRARVLLNIFDRVPKGGSGASLFLPVSVFRQLLLEVPGCPTAAVRNLKRCLSEEVTTDRYHQFYSLLYGSHEAWARELRGSMRKCQFRIRLERGQGYLIHDRKWLHGREAPEGGVSKWRLHRLVFDTHETKPTSSSSAPASSARHCR
jgi:hypothetical protein